MAWRGGWVAAWFFSPFCYLLHDDGNTIMTCCAGSGTSDHLCCLRRASRCREMTVTSSEAVEHETVRDAIKYNTLDLPSLLYREKGHFPVGLFTHSAICLDAYRSAVYALATAPGLLCSLVSGASLLCPAIFSNREHTQKWDDQSGITDINVKTHR